MTRGCVTLPQSAAGKAVTTRSKASQTWGCAALLLALLARSDALVFPHLFPSGRAGKILPAWSLRRGRPSLDLPGLITSSASAAERNQEGQLEALRNLRNGALGKHQLDFPALSAGQRAMLHAASRKLGLGHESRGQGRFRCVRVWAKDVPDRLAELKRALAEQKRSAAGRAMGICHADAAAVAMRSITHLQDELELRPEGAIARLLAFLLGPLSQAKRNESGGGGATILDACLGEEQRMAVKMCLESGAVAVIQGCPGTGKTRTVIEVVRQHVRRGNVRISLWTEALVTCD